MVFVDHTGDSDRVRQVPRGHGHGVEGRVDRSRLDGGYRGVHVGVEGDDVQLDTWVRAVEVLEHHGRRDPSAVHVDAQGSPAGAY